MALQQPPTRAAKAALLTREATECAGRRRTDDGVVLLAACYMLREGAAALHGPSVVERLPATVPGGTARGKCGEPPTLPSVGA